MTNRFDRPPNPAQPNPGQDPPIGSTLSSPSAERYLAICGQALASVLPPLLRALFGRLDVALYDLADKSANSQAHVVYFDAMRIIRNQCHTIQRNFLGLLRQGAGRAAAGLIEQDLRADQRLASEPFSLLPDTELDETLALSNLVSKAEARYQDALLGMNAHLAQLLGRAAIDPQSNPYGPFALCEAFRGALKNAQQLEPQIKLVIYKAFDKQVLDQLAPFYRQCIAAAAASDHTRTNRPGGGSGADGGRDANQATTTVAPEDIRAPGPEPTAESTEVPFETLQSLLERTRTQTAAPPPESVRVPTKELLGVLTRLGGYVLAEQITPVGSQLRERLSSVMTSTQQQPRHLERTDQDTLDLVFMFFEHLLEGNALPDPIKVLLARMQIPIAKLALRDKGLFSAREHPARRLLNHIGEAAVGWSEADGRGPNSLYGMIERVTERLILDFDGDLQLFSRMDRFFLAYLDNERTHPGPPAAADLGTARTNSSAAQQAVAAVLSAALTRYPQRPAAIESLLREGWQPIMLTIYRDDGVDSADWRQAIAIVDRLLWSVQPKRDLHERRELLRRIPELLSALRARLVKGGCDQRQVSRWFKDLQTIHLSILQAGPDQPPPDLAATRTLPAAATRRADRDTTATNADRHPEQRTDLKLPVGGWVELTRDHGIKLRYRHTGWSPMGLRLQFVDRLGRPGPDLSGTEFQDLLDQGQAAVIAAPAEPLADHAIRSVMGRLAS